MMEQELLDVAFGFEKFHSYFLGINVIVPTDHTVLRYFYYKNFIEGQGSKRGSRIKLLTTYYDLKKNNVKFER